MDVLKSEGHQVDFFVIVPELSDEESPVRPFVIPKSKFYLFVRRFISRFAEVHPTPWYEIPDLVFLYREIKNKRPDVVIIKRMKVYTALVYYICLLLGVRVILYTNQPLHVERPSVLLRLLKKVRLYPREEITPIIGDISLPVRTGANFVPFICPLFGIPEERIDRNQNGPVHMLNVGKFSYEWKRHVFLLGVFEKLLDVFDVRLTLVGQVDSLDDSNYLSIVRYIEDNGLGGKVDVKVNLPYSSMRNVYSGHDIFVFPSIGEKFGISLLEAMGNGLLPIVGDRVGAKGYVENGLSGFVFESDNGDALFSCLKRILENRELFAKMKKRAYCDAHEKYNQKAYYDALMKLIKYE